MVTVQLRGTHSVKARGKTYYYAWRGGPRLPGAPGSPEFVAAFNAAHEARREPAKGVLREVLTRYRQSPAYKRLGAHTKRAYDRYLNIIDAKWGTLPLRALEDPKVRRHFLAWRDSMASTPRTADMALGVLKRLLSWAVEHVYIGSNQADPVSRLHRADRSDAIWTPDDFAALIANGSDELLWAVELALHTGLRQSDLIRLAWNHRSGDAFSLRTSKRGKHVTIPITPECEALLIRIERRGPIILTTRRGATPWTADGLRSTFSKACADARVSRTFHDLRRTAATSLLAAGIDSARVAMMMGWSEGDVEAMKRKYVSRDEVVAAVLAKLGKGG